MNNNLSKLLTEQINTRSRKLDQLSTIDIVKLMNEEDQSVIHAVNQVIPEITEAIDMITATLQKGGKLFYIGAGTSGRLGVLDAAECPPTFYTPPWLVQGIIAGGNKAMFNAVEGAEDSLIDGEKDIKLRDFTRNDIAVGISASGRTPYVVGALTYAQKAGAKTIALSCNKNSKISKIADCKIEVLVGPEILAGSTRLKAATAQKMILNMFSTISMIKLGKVYENLMVDVHASNEKLLDRARRIVMMAANVDFDTAVNTLNITNQRVKPAIIMLKCKVTLEEAMNYLDLSNGSIQGALQLILNQSPANSKKQEGDN